MSKTVLIIMDAFRHDYISEKKTPFLYKYAKSGTYIKKIKPGNGFCERSELFTGKSPIESGYFTAFNYIKGRSHYKALIKPLAFLYSFFGENAPPLIDKVIRRILWMWSSKTKHPMHPQKIPFNFLQYFSLAEDYYDFREPGALKFDSIFDIARRNNKSIFYDSFTALSLPSNGNDQDRLNLALNVVDNDYDLYLVYIASPDAIGHKYGPNSTEIIDNNRKLDDTINAFIKSFSSKCNQSRFILLGDHGMASVNTSIDIKSIIKDLILENNWVSGKDIIYFLDSTMLRVWVLNDKIRNKLFNSLKNNHDLIKNGIFLSKENSIKYNIPYGTEYGDLIWWANPGVMIYPDFFHHQKQQPKGMHGYYNETKSSKGMCIDYGFGAKKEIIDGGDLVSVYKMLEDSLK